MICYKNKEGFSIDVRIIKIQEFWEMVLCIVYNRKTVNKMSSIVDDFLRIRLTMDDQQLIF